MDAYQTEIYKFLTQRDNFENMLKVTQNFDFVRDQLLEQFWEIVKSKIEQQLDKSIWTTGFDDLNTRYPKLYITKKTWESDNSRLLAISWEGLRSKPYYGVWMNVITTELDFDRIKEYCRSMKQLKGFQSSTYWAGWRYSNLSFDSNNGLLEILPDMREQTAEEFANTLTDLMQIMEPEMDQMFQMKKS